MIPLLTPLKSRWTVPLRNCPNNWRSYCTCNGWRLFLLLEHLYVMLANIIGEKITLLHFEKASGTLRILCAEPKVTDTTPPLPPKYFISTWDLGSALVRMDSSRKKTGLIYIFQGTVPRKSRWMEVVPINRRKFSVLCRIFISKFKGPSSCN